MLTISTRIRTRFDANSFFGSLLAGLCDLCRTHEWESSVPEPRIDVDFTRQCRGFTRSQDLGKWVKMGPV